jgi:hemolysin III
MTPTSPVADPSAPGTLTPGAEPARPAWRGWIHVGALVAVLVGGPLLVARARGGGQTLALSVYVASLVALFGVSAAFHRVTWSESARRVVRRADHITIFVAIAGTYTAVAGIALRGWARVVVLSVVWGGALAGIALRQLWLDAPKWAVALPYVVVGWSAVVVVPQLVDALGGVGFALMLAGGIAYTAGALVYARKRPNPVPGVFGYHEVFHACTVLGAALQYALVAAIVLPRS